METIALTTPESTPAITTTGYRVVAINLQWELEHIDVTFKGTNGEFKRWVVDGALATTRMKALNTANLTVKSLHRRCIELAITDGVFAGTVTGTPDA